MRNCVLMMILVSLLVWGRPVVAQAENDLAGIQSVDVVVEDVSEAGTTCGLIKNALRLAAAQSLAGAGIKEPSGTPDAILNIRVTTLHVQGGQCVSSYDARLITIGATTVAYRPARVYGKLTLEDEYGILQSSTSAHLDHVKDGVARAAHVIGANIRSANE